MNTNVAGATHSEDVNTIAFDEAPLSRFHLRVVLSGTGGQFSDGYVLGTIGLALTFASKPLQLNEVWLGLLGGASLAGLFFGSLLTGPFADRFGRRPLFVSTMAAFAVVSTAQFFVTSAAQLLVLRFVLGLALGADYVVGTALVTEFAPRRLRARLLSLLGLAWALGYTVAYGVGALLSDVSIDSWRWILASSAIPATFVFLLRLTIPESPLWLVNRGRNDDAYAVVKKHLQPGVKLPRSSIDDGRGRSPWRVLLGPAWRGNTIVGATFYTAQVIPYFAMGTFIPIVFASFGVADPVMGGLVFNLFLMLGAIAGYLVIDRITRRTFLIGSFYISALALLGLTLDISLESTAIVALFALFAFTLSAAANLEFAYLPELFPTRLRASGVGIATAASRVGSATSTFLLPISMSAVGSRWTLAACVAVLIIGGIVCQVLAPETSETNLD